ncbi:MAG: phosphoribosylformylglycinamidine synthase [Proteobacteria bacterium]|nr:phosphoribosylformylglycinamidine synthase [Pseudomonadota bacterium]
MSGIRRVFVEKKTDYAISAKKIHKDLSSYLNLSGIESVRVLIRYDIENLSLKSYQAAKNTIFSEPTVDDLYEESFPFSDDEKIFAIAYLPGQYDQRADSAIQCIRMLSSGENPLIRFAQVIVIKGSVTESDLNRIKKYILNPVDSEEVSLQKPESLEEKISKVADVPSIQGFIHKTKEQVSSLLEEMELAMSLADLLHIQNYFSLDETRDPTLTEIKMLDTYWSDHCRHTTFMTELETISIEEGRFSEPIQAALQHYMDVRRSCYGNRPKTRCLMDIAVLSAKDLIQRGVVTDIEISDEINACSIVVTAEVEGEKQEWLVMFKNETHNHPTEIEPFGGAATCIGGCIRDPLSGRSYVYQAMRVTGAADPRKSLEETLKGKLPQKRITTEAAHGYSSYGNQIGLATGVVQEIYDEGYLAKRMEIGAVIAAAPRENVKREQPEPGDIIILLGGRTGRDGCGGATGSSKQHTGDSIHTSGAEVQKGNALTERKIQRLFRNQNVAKMIKRCNDFGAGGVSVAIGELADGLVIDLDKVPKKYEGLDGTELSISESQERMAVVVRSKDVSRFINYSEEENLEAVAVAEVTAEKRMQLLWRGKKIVDLSRDFIETNGVLQKRDAHINAPDANSYFHLNSDPEGNSIKEKWLKTLSDLNVCSQKGLVEHFDSSVGSGTVHMPFGGKDQNTPTESMIAKLPVLEGDTTTGTIMSHGFDPKLSSWSPYHGAVYAVIESVAKCVAVGGDHKKIRLTLQEYFEKLGDDDSRWGKPLSALLGAYSAQQGLEIPAIGGKDSMSGTFEEISVPPTLVSFAVTPVEVDKVISPELKSTESTLIYLPLERDEYELPDYLKVNLQYSLISKKIARGEILSAHTITEGGLAAALSKMAFGNRIGFKLTIEQGLFSPDYGSIVVEIKNDLNPEKLFESISYKIVGHTRKDENIELADGTILELSQLLATWERPLEDIFPTCLEGEQVKAPVINYNKKPEARAKTRVIQPRVFIPVFPGTNCEYDTARAFDEAGAISDPFVINNLTREKTTQSLDEIARRINQSQIIVIPGGFSAGDEPEGSAKFIAAVFRSPQVQTAVNDLLVSRDGLILGICNGFQALIKLGLLPHGEFRDIQPSDPTLTFNKIGRHVSTMVQTRIVSTSSPWLSHLETGDQHSVAVSHGEGRFVARQDVIDRLIREGQVATQYTDQPGNPSMELPHNPNGSDAAIEGLLSVDGRIFGKMGHSERRGKNVARNIPGNKDQQLFAAGVRYFN